MIEVADKFNMVDMGGIDIVKSKGIAVNGLFTRLLNSIQQCRYSLLYNWYFAEISIAPSPVELVFDGEKVVINELISITPDDVIHFYSLEPTLQSLTVTQNGIYRPEGGVDGFNEVSVNVSEPRFYLLNPEDMDKIVSITPQISNNNYPYVYNVAAASYVKFAAKMNNPSSGPNCWLSQKGTYAGQSNKGFLGRYGSDRSGIILMKKVPASSYSNLHIRFEITQGYYSGGYLRLSLLKQARFGSDVWPVDADVLYNSVLANRLVADSERIIDVSGISEDFYVYFGDYSGYVKIRELYFD